MEIHVRHGSRLVEIWLANSEKRDAKLRERLKPLYREYKGKGYLVAVFESGEQDLTELTGGLLCDHRRRSARREATLERRSGAAILSAEIEAIL